MKRLSDNAFGVVAVYLKDDDFKEISYLSTSPIKDTLLRESKRLEEEGYKLNSLIITNMAHTFYSARLKAILQELRHTINYYNKCLERDRETLSAEVLALTQQLQHEYEESLMRRVAMRCQRAMSVGVEVTDEIALQCLDWRNSQLLNV